jgi:hypothetical protein
MELWDAGQIARVISERGRRQPSSSAEYVAPRTGIERKLSEIYAEFLDVGKVGVHDSFYELGGHSLLATQVLSRMRETFNVELSPRLFFATEFTVAEMAKLIMKEQIKRSDAGNLGTLLEQLNELSDEEVKALLAGKRGPAEE